MTRAPAGPRGHRVRRFGDAASFARHVGPFLEAREAEHSLLLGIIAGLAVRGEAGLPPLLVSLEPAGTRAGPAAAAAVEVVAVRTPPFPLVLSLGARAATVALADAVDDLGSAPSRPAEPSAPHAAPRTAAAADDAGRPAGATLPGVHGPRALAEAFAGAYAARRALRIREVMAMRLYRLDAVVAPAGVAGRMRPATEADRPLLEGFLRHFQDDSGVTVRQDPARAVDAYLTNPTRGLRLWEMEGRVVAMAGFMAPTAHGVRIGAVYTAPGERGRGYASALVAALSRSLLDGGRSFCVLYTDLANPTSNGLYQRIGYRPLMDAVELAFER